MQKFDNFCKALENLREIEALSEPYSVIELTGMVALFEICFEQSWKAIKEVLEDAGYSSAKTGSPKLILKTAYSSGIIADEVLWLSALESRNSATHAYNEVLALEIVRDTKEKYIGMFSDLKYQISANWLN